MTPEEQISKMKKAMSQAIKAMGDRFGWTAQDVTRAIDELKASMQAMSQPNPSVETELRSHSRLSQSMEIPVGT